MQSNKSYEPTEVAIEIPKIIAEIKAEIAEKGLKSDIPDFWDVVNISKSGANTAFNGGNFKKALEDYRQTKINYYHELTSFNESRKGIVIFVKRIIRKLLLFLLEPIIGEVNAKFIKSENLLRQLGDFAEKKYNDNSNPVTYEQLLAERKNMNYIKIQHAERLDSLEMKTRSLDGHEMLVKRIEALTLDLEIANLKIQRLEIQNPKSGESK